LNAKKFMKMGNALKDNVACTFPMELYPETEILGLMATFSVTPVEAFATPLDAPGVKPFNIASRLAASYIDVDTVEGLASYIDSNAAAMAALSATV